MVSTRSSGCVVAMTKITRSGGSSSVFSKAFDASPVSMCASSRITTLLLEAAGAYLTISRNSRIWSIPRFDAASISITSSEVPEAISLQESHSPQGVAVRSEEHTSELQSHLNLVCRLLLEKKKKKLRQPIHISQSLR